VDGGLQFIALGCYLLRSRFQLWTLMLAWPWVISIIDGGPMPRNFDGLGIGLILERQ
jgi:hypothetical protein